MQLVSDPLEFHIIRELLINLSAYPSFDLSIVQSNITGSMTMTHTDLPLYLLGESITNIIFGPTSTLTKSRGFLAGLDPNYGPIHPDAFKSRRTPPNNAVVSPEAIPYPYFKSNSNQDEIIASVTPQMPSSFSLFSFESQASTSTTNPNTTPDLSNSLPFRSRLHTLHSLFDWWQAAVAD
jgi:hypothetical protein